MNYRSKIFNKAGQECLDMIRSWKSKGLKIVFTNGCFDIIHAGHIRYLSEAKKTGDILVIGLNSDSSVKRLKGDNRPVNEQYARAEVLAYMGDVDMVVIFDEDTPYELIKLIVPDALVKGGDWSTDNIIGSDIVLKNKGVVKSLSYIEGFSTSKVIEKIKN